MLDEATLRDRWRHLPMVGDEIKMKTWPFWEAVVIDTFYRQGERGMHIRFTDGGCAWACADRWRVVRRWYLREEGGA